MAKRKTHTPGPWRVIVEGTMTGRGPVIVLDEDRDANLEIRELAALETAETCESKTRNPRAEWKRRPDYDEIMANAQLMAAAPDLLDAVKGALKGLGALATLFEFDPDEVSWITPLINAVNKAERKPW